jgi:mono/diheme cytochrome c family protein
MKNKLRSLSVIGLATLVTIAFAYAQRGGNAIQVDIPFGFSVGKSALPAGTYQFVTEQNNSRINIRGPKDSAIANVISQLGGATIVPDPTLVFDVSEGTRTLSEVWIPGSSGLLLHTIPSNHNHEVVVALPKEFSKLSGKDAFDRTCKRCHGVGGKGDADADKFFKKQIPRLNSDYVQTKSDDELKTVITQGKSEMPPVRLDRPGMGHLLPPDSVAAVIAYVRTLKAAK